MEPEYIAQSADTADGAERQTWVEFHFGSAKARGCAFFRATFDDERNWVLFEAWKERPENQGEPRWQIAA